MIRNWKVISLDYTALLDFDSEVDIVVCLTQRQVAILKSLLATAYWETRWTNLSISKDELKANMADIDYRLNGGTCEGFVMDYRDNPNDLCEVQYSKDGGETWLTMFRKDVCRAGATSTDITNIYNDITIVENNYTTWDNDIINIAPKWEYVDAYSDNALCWAINFYVDMVCDFAIKEIETYNIEARDSNDWMDDLSGIIATGIIAGIAATVGSVTLPAIAIGAIVWAVNEVIDALFDWWVGKDSSVFEDEEARQVVKCAMFQAQSGETPQFPNWRDSLNEWDLFGGNAKGIAGSVHLWNAAPNIYINYMLLMEELIVIKETLPECPCPEDWIHIWNFETHGLEAWTIDGDYGEYQSGVGVVATLQTYPSGWKMNIVRMLALNEAIPRCTRFRATYTIVRGAFDDVGYYGTLLQAPPEEEENWNASHMTTGEKTFSMGFDEQTLDYVRIADALSCETEGTDYGSLIVTKVTLEGHGVDPFYGRVTS